MVPVYLSEGMPIRINKEKGREGRVQQKTGMSFPLALPGGVRTQTELILPTCDDMYEELQIREAHLSCGVQGFYCGSVT